MTTRDVYVRHSFKISAAFSLLLCALSLLATANLGDGGGGRNAAASCEAAAAAAAASPASSSEAAVAVPATHMFPGDISPAGLYAIYLAITLLVRARAF